MVTAKKTGKAPMSKAHKAALAKGRAQGRAVRAYLDALEANRPRRGRKRTRDSVKKRLAAVTAELPQATPIDQLHLEQEKMNLEAELARFDAKTDLSELERAFIDVAAEYGASKGISYAAWRKFVPADVLKKAGITRGA